MILPYPPDDASATGAQWDAICAYLTRGRISESRGDLVEHGKIVLEDDTYLFRGRDMRANFTLNRLDFLPLHEMWDLVRSRGGKSQLVRVGTTIVRTWALPAAAIEVRADPADILEAPIPEEPPLGLHRSLL